MHFTAEHEQFRIDRPPGRRAGDRPATSTSGRRPASSRPTSSSPSSAAAGLLGLEYDPAYGGQGADHSYTVIYGEEVGRAGCGGVPMAISVQTDMATPVAAPLRHATSSRSATCAPAIRGEMVAAIAVTEPDAGSDVAGIRTRAVRDGDEWVINGSKLYITNGTQADWLCLLARTSDDGGYRGMSQIVVPTDRPGFSVSRKLDKLGQPVERHRRAVVRRPAGAGGQHDRRDRPGLPAADGPVPERAHDRRLHVDRRHAGRRRAHHRVRQAAPGVRPARSPTTSTSSSPWPSWSPRSTWPAPTTTPAPRPYLRGEDTHPPRHHRQAHDRPAQPQGRRHVHPVPRRHRLHGGDLDRPVLPRLAACCRSAAAPTR